MATVQQEGSFQGKGDLRLHYKRWLPAEGRPQATLIISHGNGEHTGRYEHLARHFAERRVAVYCMDLRGYGRSGGVRGHVGHFDDYLADLRIFSGLVVDYSAGLGRPVLLGHSLGGLIALRYAEVYPQSLGALILCSPWLGLSRSITTPQRVAVQLLAALAPRSHWRPGKGDPGLVRRDPAAVKLISEDPLRVRAMTPRWFTEALRAQRVAIDGSMDLAVPSLWLQAGKDYVVSGVLTQATYEQVRHPDKTFRLFPDAYHELHNEPEAERNQVFAAIAEWLQTRGILDSGG